MTLEQYMEKRNEYIQKQEHYKKKVAELDEKYFLQMNKGNRFLKSLSVEEIEHYEKLAEHYNGGAHESIQDTNDGK